MQRCQSRQNFYRTCFSPQGDVLIEINSAHVYMQQTPFILLHSSGACTVRMWKFLARPFHFTDDILQRDWLKIECKARPKFYATIWRYEIMHDCSEMIAVDLVKCTWLQHAQENSNVEENNWVHALKLLIKSVTVRILVISRNYLESMNRQSKIHFLQGSSL